MCHATLVLICSCFLKSEQTRIAKWLPTDVYPICWQLQSQPNRNLKWIDVVIEATDQMHPYIWGVGGINHSEKDSNGLKNNLGSHHWDNVNKAVWKGTRKQLWRAREKGSSSGILTKAAQRASTEVNIFITALCPAHRWPPSGETATRQGWPLLVPACTTPASSWLTP